jgi:hypothetical protein
LTSSSFDEECDPTSTSRLVDLWASAAPGASQIEAYIYTAQTVTSELISRRVTRLFLFEQSTKAFTHRTSSDEVFDHMQSHRAFRLTVSIARSWLIMPESWRDDDFGEDI